MTRVDLALAAVAAALLALVATVASIRDARGEDRHDAPTPPGATAGTWQKFCAEHDQPRFRLFVGTRDESCRHQQAGDSIEADEVWCRWSGANVLVHLRVRNSFGEPVTTELTPRYVTASGQHGTFTGSHVVVTLAPNEMTTLEIVAGTPKNTPDGARIASCTPRLEDAYLTVADPAA